MYDIHFSVVKERGKPLTK